MEISKYSKDLTAPHQTLPTTPDPPKSIKQQTSKFGHHLSRDQQNCSGNFVLLTFGQMVLRGFPFRRMALKENLFGRLAFREFLFGQMDFGELNLGHWAQLPQSLMFTQKIFLGILYDKTGYTHCLFPLRSVIVLQVR